MVSKRQMAALRELARETALEDQDWVVEALTCHTDCCRAREAALSLLDLCEWTEEEFLVGWAGGADGA